MLSTNAVFRSFRWFIIKDTNVLYDTNVNNYCLIKIFLIKNIDPIIEGITRFITHKIMVDSIICNKLLENNPIKKIASEPLIPNSSKVVVGISVENRYKRLMEIKA